MLAVDGSTVTATPAAATVHVTLDNFQALSEFWDDPTDPDTRDACGPDAYLMNVHALFGVTLNQQELEHTRDEMRALGLFGSGCTIENLAAYVAHEGYTVSHKIPYGQGQADAIHQALKDYCVQKHGVILQVAAAYNLPGSQPGVNSHFVAIGGIDSVAGYLMGNGDDVNALAAAGGHGKIIPTRWVSWGNLLAAQPVAFLSIQGRDAGKPYMTNPDGTLQYSAGRLGLGFSNLVRTENRTSDLMFPDYYYNANECCCEFYDGTTYHYDKRTGQSQNGKAALIIQGMRDALLAHGVTGTGG